MARVFDKMASLEGFAPEDVEELFAAAPELTPGDVGAVLGYLLGRLDCRDAVAFVSAVRQLHPRRRVALDDGRTSVNIVGTGGGPSTFNITTTVAFVVAAAGAVVVKTGSAAARSKAGFADVAAKLATLKVTMPWEQLETTAREVGIVFVPPSLHAPQLGRLIQHLPPPVYRNAALYLNKIGPLLAPVAVDHHFVGANSQACQRMLAAACAALGDVPTTLLAADDGMDEASTGAATHVVELKPSGRRDEWIVDPASLGIAPPESDDLVGFEPAAAAECCERILAGEGSRPQNDIVALNAGVVLSSLRLVPSLADGLERARQILRDGLGHEKLRQLRARVWKTVKL